MVPTIIVVGAGVIGLTTAVRILESSSNTKVIILSKDLPGDPLIPTYASPCAGAHHLSFAADDDNLQRKIDKRTFDVMWAQIKAAEESTSDKWERAYGEHLLKLTQTEYYCHPGDKHIAFFEDLPDFQVLEPPKESQPPILHSVSFTSMTMDTGPYLDVLVQHFKALGGVLERAELGSLAEAIDYPAVVALAFDDLDIKKTEPTRIEAIINCTGLGSIHLSDVNDTSMYPVRGHVLVLDAPWVKEGRTRQVGSLAASETLSSDSSSTAEEVGGGEGGERTYIIPRKSGQVVIGGTREVGDWSATPDAATTLSIKRRALEIFPELSPLYLESPTRKPLPEDLDSIVLKEVVGFRPARKDGLRLSKGSDVAGVKVIHNYGHSGAGWQASWGCAEEVVFLLKE